MTTSTSHCTDHISKKRDGNAVYCSYTRGNQSVLSRSRTDFCQIGPPHQYQDSSGEEVIVSVLTNLHSLLLALVVVVVVNG